MTQTYSQKRFRHNNNTAPRFRDQPPRFKRQKSSTDPEEEHFEKKENITSFSPSKTYTNKTNPSSAMKNPLKEQVMRATPVEAMPPLSVETDMIFHNAQPMNVYGYREFPFYHQTYATPPFSPISTASCVSVHDMSGYRPPPVSPVAFSSPYISPGLEMANAKTSLSSPTTKPNHEGHVVYSDPDKQTILLLRELERVADEKEKEDQEKERDVGNGNGTDRKNLVSHHLRMLMCAVDRYTADVDETSSSDGCVSEASASPAPSTASPAPSTVSPAPSSVPSPCPTPTPKSFTPQPNQWQMHRMQQSASRNSPTYNRQNDLFPQQLKHPVPKNPVRNNVPIFSKLVPPPTIPFYSTPPPPVSTQNAYPIPRLNHEKNPAPYQQSYGTLFSNAPQSVNSYNHKMPFNNQSESNAQPTPLDNLAHLLHPNNLEIMNTAPPPQAQDKDDWNLWSSPSFVPLPFDQYKR